MSPKFVYSKDKTNILTNHRQSKQYVMLTIHDSNQLGHEMHKSIEFRN